ncbi:hypothetical protein BCV71DRAFT_226594, partial [Rhizopus microsporus]
MSIEQNSFEFQPPTNIRAIRTSIAQRIKQRNEKKQQICLDNGLPSPPIEAYESDKLSTDQVMNALIDLSSKEPMSSPPLSPCTKEPSLDTEAIRQRIKQLQEEKHKLFQTMKDLLSKQQQQQQQ